jgi:hypothetical protein
MVNIRPVLKLTCVMLLLEEITMCASPMNCKGVIPTTISGRLA